jgi:hypothetical protein
MLNKEYRKKIKNAKGFRNQKFKLLDVTCCYLLLNWYYSHFETHLKEGNK